MQNELKINNATQVIALFETTKEQRLSIAQSIIDKLESGEINPLKMHVKLKKMSATIDLLLDKKAGGETAKKYNEYLMDAAQQYGKNFEVHNAKFETKEAGVKYDYSQCNDERIIRLNAELEALNIKIKEREAYLKALPSVGVDVLDSDSGEVVRLYPPSKSSTTTIAVKL